MKYVQLEDIVLHLFGLINKYELRARLGPDHKAIWELVASDGYLLKNCKLYLWSYHVNKLAGVQTSPAAYGVGRADAARLRKVDLSGLPLFRAYTLQEFDMLERTLLVSKHLEVHIQKFVNKKLRFLVSYGTYTKDCIHSHLLAAAIMALRKQYPRFESELHAFNACKTAIHNSGMGLIEYSVRGKRNVLQMNGDKTFSSINSSISGMEATLEATDTREHEDLRLSLNQVAQKMKPRARAFFDALRGQPNADFVAYGGDDDDIEVVRKKARKFYNVSEAQEEYLFKQVRELL